MTHENMVPGMSVLPWEYSMRREMQEVVDGIYIGPFLSASRKKLHEIESAGITHIICIRQREESSHVRPFFPDVIQYLVLEIADLPSENIIQHFATVRNFINTALASGGRVLMHSLDSISRSPSLLIAYIMERFCIGYKDAFRFVQSRRFCIAPNEGFESQLLEYEAIYRSCDSNSSISNKDQVTHSNNADGGDMFVEFDRDQDTRSIKGTSGFYRKARISKHRRIPEEWNTMEPSSTIQPGNFITLSEDQRVQVGVFYHDALET